MLWLLRHNKVNHIVLVGGRDTRLNIARELGADAILNYHELGNETADVLHHNSVREFRFQKR